MHEINFFRYLLGIVCCSVCRDKVKLNLKKENKFKKLILDSFQQDYVFR